jgi:hypothetical protein
MLKNDTGEKLHVQRILAWQEAVATLPDNRFFDIMRVYLGEIKTPYNKQRLIEQLGAFLHKEQNRKNLTAMLDDFDKKIITAVSLLPNVTQTRLCDFFSGEYTLSQLYTRLLNLTDRLIIYTAKQEKTGQQYIHLNPLLEEVLAPYVSTGRVLPAAVCAVHTDTVYFRLSPEFIAAFVSYITEKPELCRADGTIKKNNEARLEEIFPGKSKCLQLLFTAFLNLQLIKQNERNVAIDRNRFLSFAGLPEKKQYAYLCAASTGRLSREGLRSQAQLFLDCTASIPPDGVTRQVLLRTAVLLGDTSVRQNRFSRIIEQARQGELNTPETAGQMFDRIIDSAEVFGLLDAAGKTAAGEKIYRRGTPLVNPEMYKEPYRKVVNIDAGFTITVLPGLPLKKLLPLVSFLCITRCNTVAEFEINRMSAVRAFDAGYTAEEICRLLSEYTPYDIPQNLRIRIEDWNKSYASATMYKGYILKLDEKNAQLMEKNPNSSKFIQSRLGQGIYLLNIKNDDEAALFTDSCGLDFIGKVQSVTAETDSAAFPLISDTDMPVIPGMSESILREDEQNGGGNVMKELHEALDKLDLTPMQKNGLSLRIDHKMILSTGQLKGSTVHAENLEAGGIDFLGKLRLIESAISSKDMIEISMPAGGDPSKQQVFLGTPLQLTKETGDVFLHMQLEPGKEAREFSVSRAGSVKLIRSSLF